MSEVTANVEFAHKIQEQGHRHGSPGPHRAQWIEMIEALVLAIVAVATAWRGYQAAKWDAVSSKNYNLASRTTVLSEEKATLASQDRLYDITTFDAWVNAKVEGREKLTAFYERHFRPEYAAAFAAWWKLDPIHNTAAPPGPVFMAEYKSANRQESVRLAEQATCYFENAVSMRESGDKYVRVTVFLATVLLLTALSQRFEILGARIAVVAVAFTLLVISTYWILTFPRV